MLSLVRSPVLNINGDKLATMGRFELRTVPFVVDSFRDLGNLAWISEYRIFSRSFYVFDRHDCRSLRGDSRTMSMPIIV